MARYGRRLLVSVLESETQQNPARIFASIPATPNGLENGFVDVSFAQVQRAVDEVAHRLQQAFTLVTHETIAYVGVTDLRYNLLFYAALKCRIKVLLLSPRNAGSINASLFEQTNCTKFVHTEGIEPIQSMQCLELPSIQDLLTARPDPIAYDLGFEVRDEPVLVLHSSGSTGLPKPVTMTHGSLATYDSDHIFPTIPGRQNLDLTAYDTEPGGRMYSMFPIFHLAGVVSTLLMPLYTNLIPIFGSVQPPSAASVRDILRTQKVHACFLPPSMAAELYHSPGGPPLLQDLGILVYTGGPLSDTIGNELIQHVTLCQSFGSTEVGNVRQLVPAKENWQYLEFHPLANLKFEPVDDAYEMIVCSDESQKDFSSLGHNFPGISEYRTNDLFTPHPSTPGLWTFHARRDDILVLSSGEKVNPVPMEHAMGTIEGIRGALVVGHGEPLVGLLLELEPHDDRSDPLSHLWPLIHRCNPTMPPHGHVLKSMVSISSKPFVRAGTGTVVRTRTIAEHATELKALFAGAAPTAQPRPMRGAEDVRSLVRSTIQETLGTDVPDTGHLLSHGLDSVKSIEVMRRLQRRIDPTPTWLSVAVMYNNATINELSSVIGKWIDTGDVPPMDRLDDASQILDEYRSLLPVTATNQHPEDKPSGKTVVIVGSTGSIGRKLLAALVDDRAVGHIYCLDRSAAAPDMGDHTDEFTSKITFYQVEFNKPAFGLSDAVQDRLAKCDLIIHLAWQVNFLLSLSGFYDSFTGLVSSIHLAATGPRLLFVSSISAFGTLENPASSPRVVPEEAAELHPSMKTAYGESKLVGEQLIFAAKDAGIRATVLRFGQICPATSGAANWSKNDALTTLLESSKVIQAVPTDLPDVDWIPIDLGVLIIQDVIRHHEHSLSFYNVVNPVPTPWQALLPTIADWCGPATQRVTLEEWVDRVRGWTGDSKPSAVRLLPFFEMLTRSRAIQSYQQDKLLRASPAARGMQAVDSTLLQRWLSELE